MTAPPDVVDVVPPDHLPPIRPRSRVQSAFLVLVALVMTCSLGLINPAPAGAFVGAVVPVVKGVASIVATTVAGEVVFTKNDDGGDSEDSKKARGKWGNRLKGLPGLAAGLLGGMAGWLGLGEMIDGVKAPDDFKTDTLSDPENVTVITGSLAQFTITGFRFGTRTTSNNVSYQSVWFDATCTGNSNICTSSTPGRQLSGVSFSFRCFDASTGEFYNDVRGGVYMNGWFVPGIRPPCPNLVSPEHGVPNQWQSVLPIRTPGSTQPAAGIANPSRVFNPVFDPGAESDQGVSITADGTCRLPDGGTVRVSKTTAGLDVIPTVQCPDGSVPESIDWTSNVGGKQENLGGVGTNWDPFPECAGFQCQKLIKVDDVPCRVGIEACYDWQNVDPGRVKCEYGPYALGLAECGDLQHMYKTGWGVTQDPAKGPQRQPGWLPSNPDGTVDWTRVGTGDYRPDDVPNPEYKPPVAWNPEAPPGGDPTPDPPGQPVPPTVSVPNPPGNPKDPDNPTKNCMGGMASWNPVDWIYTPVKCALTWAFVPPNGSGPNLIGDFRAKVLTAELGAWLAIPDDLFGSLPQGSGCMGPPLHMPEPLGGKTYYPLNACSDPMAKYANMSRSLITIVVVFYGLFSIVNSLTVAMTGYRMFDRETAGLAKQVT